MATSLLARKRVPIHAPEAPVKGSGKTAAVGNTPRCKDGNRSDRIDHCGNEWHRCDLTTHMTPGFPSLCDNGVNPARYRVPRFCSRADGVEHCGTTRLSAGHKA